MININTIITVIVGSGAFIITFTTNIIFIIMMIGALPLALT